MRHHGDRRARRDALAAAVLLGLAVGALGCTFDPNGIALSRPDSSVADGGVADTSVIDGDVADGDVIDGDLVDGDVVDGAVIDGAVADAFVFMDAATPDAFVFMDAAPPDAFIFMDARVPDAQTDPGTGEVFATSIGAGVTITIDGNLDSTTEWPRARCVTLNNTTDHHSDDDNRAMVTGPGPTDSAALFCVQWNAQGFYFGARVTEDTHRGNSVNIYDDDSIAFYLDGDNTRDGTVDANDFALVIAPPTFGGTRADDFFHNGTPSGSMFAAQERGGGANMDIEAFVPWSAITGSGTLGRRLGFEVNLLDDDDAGFGEGGAENSMWWFLRASAQDLCTGHEDPWCNPGTIGEVILR